MDNIEIYVEKILREIGENEKRNGLIETPKRVSKMYSEIFSGYKTDMSNISKTFDAEGYAGFVIVKDIDFFSTCEHHMVPFFGKIHIGYIPNDKIIGLSKFGRIVEAYSRRLQVQERLTDEIANYIENVLKPKGVIVVIEAVHFCMVMRGIQKINSRTVTSVKKGTITNEEYTEFFNLINPTK